MIKDTENRRIENPPSAATADIDSEIGIADDLPILLQFPDGDDNTRDSINEEGHAGSK